MAPAPAILAKGPKCPICGYPIGANRCPECGSVLSEECDEELLRHIGFTKGRRLLWALHMLAAAPLLIGSSIAAFLIVLLGSILSSEILSSEPLFLGGGAVLVVICTALSTLALLAGGWMSSHSTFTRQRSMSRRAKWEIGLVGGSMSTYVAAGYVSPPAPLAVLLASLVVLAIGALVWTQAGICAAIWNRTRRARYVNGARRRPNRVVPAGFRGAAAAWVVVTVIGMVLGNGTPIGRIMDALAPLGAMLLIIMGAVALIRVVRDVRDELSIQEQKER